MGTWIEMDMYYFFVPNRLGRSLRGNVDRNIRSFGTQEFADKSRSLRGNVDRNNLPVTMWLGGRLCRSLRGNVDRNCLLARTHR